MLTKITSQIIKESRLLLYVSIILLLSSALFYFLVIPQVNKLIVNRTEYKSVNNLISSESGFLQIKKDIQLKNDKLIEKVASFSGPLSDGTPELSYFLETLIAKAKASEIRFVKMEPQAENKGRDFNMFPILLDFTTTYHSLGQFVSSIEKLPQLYRVNRIFIEAKSEGRIGVKILITCLIPLKEKP
jgi:Tfp pilus assembly protein PilO